MEVNEITGIIVDRAIHIHRTLGPGLLERVYHSCLEYELRKAGLQVVSEKYIPLIYESLHFDPGYRVDMMVEDQVILELKAVEFLHEVHTAQILTYLKLSGCKVGLLINFNVALLKDGIRRFIR